MVMSAYLWHSEGMTSRSIDLILAARAVAKSHGGPWLLLGDFNNQPAAVESALRVALKAAGAAIVATTVPTHYAGGDMTPAVLDYAVVDARVANTTVVRSIEVAVVSWNTKSPQISTLPLLSVLTVHGP